MDDSDRNIMAQHARESEMSHRETVLAKHADHHLRYYTEVHQGQNITLVSGLTFTFGPVSSAQVTWSQIYCMTCQEALLDDDDRLI